LELNWELSALVFAGRENNLLKTEFSRYSPWREVKANDEGRFSRRSGQECQDQQASSGEAVDATFEGITKAVKKSRRFQVPGFGTFTVRSRKARKGRNPQTGAIITIKASRTVGFKPAPTLKKGL
jgi:DNA-binding protein HU-beta